MAIWGNEFLNCLKTTREDELLRKTMAIIDDLDRLVIKQYLIVNTLGKEYLILIQSKPNLYFLSLQKSIH